MRQYIDTTFRTDIQVMVGINRNFPEQPGMRVRLNNSCAVRRKRPAIDGDNGSFR